MNMHKNIHLIKRRFYDKIPAYLKSFIRRIVFLFSRKTFFRLRDIVRIEAILTRDDPIKLEIGSGKRTGKEGWIFADLNNPTSDLQIDAGEHLPLPDNCVSIIYSSHLLEHLRADEIRGFLAECHRILKPGCSFSAAVPNAKIYIDAYYKPADFNYEKYCTYDKAKARLSFKAKIDYINYTAYSGGEHHHMFDEESLIVYLTEAGFRNVRIREFDRTLDDEKRRYESIYAKGEK